MYEDLTPEQRELADHMSDLSEDFWCAGWLCDLEFILWDEVVNGPDRFDPCDVEKLRELSQAAGGWIVWDDGEKFLPLAEWLDRYARGSSKDP